MALVTLQNSKGQTVSVEECGVIYNSYLTGSHASEGWKVVSAPIKETTLSATTPVSTPTSISSVSTQANSDLETFLKLLRSGLSEKQVKDLVVLYKSGKKLNSTDAKNLAYAFGERESAAQYHTNKTTSYVTGELSGDRSRAGKLPASVPSEYLVFAGLQAAPVTPTMTQDEIQAQKATLTSPDGKQKAVVIVGSGEAAQLQGLGWTLGDIGTTIVDPKAIIASLPASEQDAINNLAESIANNPAALALVTLTPDDIDRFIQEGIVSAKTELSPYYEEQKKLISQKYTQGLSDLAAQRDIETQIEAINRQKSKEAIQSDLESRGVTFSGEAAGTLGTESGLPPELTAQLEGKFQKEQKLISSTSAMRFGQQARDIGQTAETTLGSSNLQSSSLYSPTLGVRGSLEREQTTNEQLRGAELARSRVAREMMKNPDFAQSNILSYI